MSEERLAEYRQAAKEAEREFERLKGSPDDPQGIAQENALVRMLDAKEKLRRAESGRFE